MGLKVQAVAWAAGLATIMMWLGGYFLPDLFGAAPTGLEAAFTAIIATAAGWFKRERSDQAE